MTQDLWETVVLEKVLNYRKEFIQINDLDNYKRCRVQCHVQGIVLRDVVQGIQIRTKSQQVCRANDFLVAEIDAKLGGFGIVPEDLGGAIVSSHYYLYEIDEDLLDKQFFYFFIKTSYFRDQVFAQGSTNYAAIRSNDVLGYKMPLPPIAEQQRIVERIEKLVEKIEEAQELRSLGVKECESILDSFQKNLFPLNSDSIKLEEIATVIDPNPSHRYPFYTSQGIPIVSTVDFIGEDEISTKNVKQVSLSFYEDTLGRFNIGHGDIIFSRKGKIGYARQHPPEIKLAMTHTLCVIKPDRKKILPQYFLHFTRSSAFISYLMGTMNPNVGVPTLGLGVIRSAPLNLPSLAEQARIVLYLDNLKAKVDEIHDLRKGALKKIDALLPAILDKAFKGEL